MDASLAAVTKDDNVIYLLDKTGLGGLSYNDELGEKLAACIENHASDLSAAESEFTELATEYSDYEVPTPTSKSKNKKGGALIVHAAEEAPIEVMVNASTNQPLSVKEYYLVQKQNDIAAYANVLSGVDGKKYSDDDGDGIIKIDKIDGGDYVLLCNPQNGYATSKFESKVTVKAELEYKKVENIKKEVVKDAGDTKPAEATPIEAVPADTVEYVKSAKEKTYEYTETSAKSVAASKSGSAKSAEAVDNGASISLDAGEVTLYALNGANSVNVALTKTVGASAGTFASVTPTTSGDVTVKASGDTYTIATSTSAGTSTGSVTFTATYNYKEAVTTTTRRSGGFIRTAAATTTTTGGEESSSEGEAAATTTTTTTTTGGEGGEGGAATGGESGSTGTTGGESGATGTTGGEGTTGGDTGNTTPQTPQTVDKTGTMTVTLKVNIIGAETALTAEDGSALCKNQDVNQPATLADVTAGAKLYVAKETYIYTGWQSLNNISYYFNKNHEKVTGSQVIQGVKYNFGTDGALLPSGMGIDVSKWQGTIDWAAVAPNISFAIIRCGYRGSSGGLSIDPQYARNMQQAKANGVKVGVYFYSKATNEAMAVEEASLAIQLVQEQGGVSLPIYMDMEDATQKGLSSEELTNIANAFCATVASAGYRPGVYASYNWWNNHLNAGAVNGSKWVARYNTICGLPCDIWQYSSKGTLPGINGNVDINQSYF